MCWYFGQIEPWQILRNKQTIRDSWLGLVIVPSVYHCQGPQKTLFLLWVWGLKAKHCHWITAPPCSAWRKSFLCRLCWAWACVALGWNVYITMHASWCSPACVTMANSTQPCPYTTTSPVRTMKNCQLLKFWPDSTLGAVAKPLTAVSWSRRKNGCQL